MYSFILRIVGQSPLRFYCQEFQYSVQLVYSCCKVSIKYIDYQKSERTFSKRNQKKIHKNNYLRVYLKK